MHFSLVAAVLAASAHLLSVPFFGQLGRDVSVAEDKPVAGHLPVLQCDAEAPQALTVKRVDLSPNPPEKGTNLTISAVGVLSQEVTDGAYVEVDVFYGYIKLIHQTYDLCEYVTEVGLECPLAPGTYDLTKEVEIPAEVPPGRYVATARAYTEDDEYISCLTGTIVFPR